LHLEAFRIQFSLLRLESLLEVSVIYLPARERCLSGSGSLRNVGISC